MGNFIKGTSGNCCYIRNEFRSCYIFHKSTKGKNKQIMQLMVWTRILPWQTPSYVLKIGILISNNHKCHPQVKWWHDVKGSESHLLEFLLFVWGGILMLYFILVLPYNKTGSFSPSGLSQPFRSSIYFTVTYSHMYPLIPSLILLLPTYIGNILPKRHLYMVLQRCCLAHSNTLSFFVY